MNIAPAWPPSQDEPSSRSSSEDPLQTPSVLDDPRVEPWDVPVRRSLAPRTKWLTLILLLVVGCGSGWFLLRQWHQAAQREAAEQLAQYGGDAAYYRNKVVQLSFSGRRFRDEALGQLSKFPYVSRLVLIDTSISSEGLRQLRSAPPALSELAIIGAPDLSSSGLDHLRSLPQLRVLRLTSVPLTDEGLAPLKSLQQLERLDLIDTRITDAGLKHLAALTSAKRILLNRTGVTRAGVEQLQRALPKTTIVYDVEEP